MADGFVVQWGRYSWNRHLPSLSFTRQLAVVEDADQTNHWQPDLWQLDLALVFEDEPDLMGLDTLELQDTGFSFTPVGPDRVTELAELPVAIHQYPPLLAAWNATPVETRLSFGQVC
jgi:hypothetical protein